jgi:lysophospholipase L1-like esterase
MARNNRNLRSPFFGILVFQTLFLLSIGSLVAACGSDENQPIDSNTLAGMGATTSPVTGLGGAAGGVTGIGGSTIAAGGKMVTGGTGVATTTGTAGTSGKAGGGVAGTAGKVTAGAGGGAAGSAGKAGASGGAAGTAGGAAGNSGNKLIPDRCKGTDGSMVAFIGDSYIALSNDIPRMVEDYSGQSYRNYSVSGTVISQIRQQAQLAYATPTQTLLMTGGGNDALLNTNCLLAGFANPSCKTDVDNAIAVIPDLLGEAETAGVQEVVFFYYPHITGSTNASAMNDIDDYAIPLVQKHCEDRTKLQCTFIDTRADFEGKQAQLLIFDGIHPNATGSKIIADKMWAVMQDNCKNGLNISQ